VCLGQQQRCPAACSFVVVAEAPRRIFFAAPKGAGSPGVNVRASIEQARFRLGASGIVAFVWVTVSSGVPAARRPPPSRAGRGEYSGSVLLSDAPLSPREAYTPAPAGCRRSRVCAPARHDAARRPAPPRRARSRPASSPKIDLRERTPRDGPQRPRAAKPSRGGGPQPGC
jgi:hypothetical protein